MHLQKQVNCLSFGKIHLLQIIHLGRAVTSFIGSFYSLNIPTWCALLNYDFFLNKHIRLTRISLNSG